MQKMQGNVERVPLALDLVEEGTQLSVEAAGTQRVDGKLPQGVTSRHLYRDVVRIAWPSLVELTLTQLTSMVDLMMVGGLGPVAIAAVGLTTQPKFLLMTMFMAMNVGATALVARGKSCGSAVVLTKSCGRRCFSFVLLPPPQSWAISSQGMVRFMSSGACRCARSTVYSASDGRLHPFALPAPSQQLRGVALRTAMVYTSSQRG